MNKPDWIHNIKALGWDLDGTLYPPTSIPTEVIQELQYKAVMEANEWDRVQTEEEFRDTYAELGSHTKTLTALGVDGPKFFTDMWDELPLEEYIRHDRKIIEMFALLGNMHNFIITNSNTREQVERKLKLIGLPTTIFEVIVTTVDLGAVKPDPKPFTTALQKMAIMPQQAMFIGDRVTTDIRGAKNIGMKTCLVWGQSDEADISLKDIYLIPKLLFEK